MARQKVPKKVEAAVLTRSGRRCCICVGLSGDWNPKKGQIAHLDHDPSNNAEDNLAFLCFDHHDQYDSKTRQSKNFTETEVKRYRRELYSDLYDHRETWNRVPSSTADEGMPKAKLPDFEALIALARVLSLAADRDHEYATLLALALNYHDPDTALRLARMFSLAPDRDHAYGRILQYFLDSGEPTKALPLVRVFSLAPDRDAAKRRVLEAMKNP